MSNQTCSRESLFFPKHNREPVDQTLWENEKNGTRQHFFFSNMVFYSCLHKGRKKARDGILFASLHKCRLPSPISSVGSVTDVRTGGRWFDLRLGQYSFWGLMIVIATGFIPFSPLSVVWTMVMWESSQWLGKNIVRSNG